MHDLKLAARFADEALTLAREVIVQEGRLEPSIEKRVRAAS